MGGFVIPAPLVPVVQLIIIAFLPLVPYFWAVTIFSSLKRIYNREPIRDVVTRGVGEILITAMAPLGMSFFIWAGFWAQIFLVTYGVFYLVWWLLVSPIRFIRACFSRGWSLDPKYKAYPLMRFDTSYKYGELKGTHEIRLLVLHPGTGDDPLKGDIIGTDLRRRPKYDALSYTWADETGDDSLSSTIHCLRSDSEICITKNCEAALRCLRLPNNERRLWVDAVCINQHSYAERSHQVSLMSDIYVNAQHVIAYTGEGTDRTDLLYDWLNGIDIADLNIPSAGMFRDINVPEGSSIYYLVQVWNKPGGAKDMANKIAVKFERYWRIGSDRLSTVFRRRDLSDTKVTIPEAELEGLVMEYFSRRWFKRVWVLQEVSLPSLTKTRVVCGSKITTAERAMHLVSLLKTQGSGDMMWIFVLLRQRFSGQVTSHLLDILIETRHRECGEPRDKIFGVLSIAQWMDNGRFPHLTANYFSPTSWVYWSFSEFFMEQHGPGFFLSLIKSPQKVEGLPSWAADWTVPWPNYNAVKGVDFAARSRIANEKDGNAKVIWEEGMPVLIIHRPRITKGYFTLDGHIDGVKQISTKSIESLKEGQLLIEMYPGLAALLTVDDSEYYRFVRVCPHALSKRGVEQLVGKWSHVVVYMDGVSKDESEKFETIEYLTNPQMYKIR
jgi:hypothetical protein